MGKSCGAWVARDRCVLIVPAILALLVASNLVIIFIAPSDENATQPETCRVQLGETVTCHLGVVNQGASASATITLVNSGVRDVRVVDSQSSCGCVQIQSCPRSIPGTNAAPLTLLMSPKVAGAIQQRVIVLTDNPDSQRNAYQVDVTMTAKGILSSMGTIDFGFVSGNQRPTSEFTISVFGYRQVEFLAIDSGIPTIEALTLGVPSRTFRGVGQDDVRHDQRVRAQIVGMSCGPQNALLQCTVKCDDEVKTLSIPLRADFLGTVECSPRSVVLGLLRPSGAVTDAVEVKILQGDNQQIDMSQLEVTSDTENITCALRRDASNQIVLTLSVDRGRFDDSTARSFVRGMIGTHEAFRIPVLVLKYPRASKES